MMPVRSSAASSRRTRLGVALALVVLTATGAAQSGSSKTFPVPTPLVALPSASPPPVIVPFSPEESQNAAVRAQLANDLSSLPEPGRSRAVQDATIQRIYRGIAVRVPAQCDSQGNCPIFYYLQTPDRAYHVALRGSGQAIAAASLDDIYHSLALVISRKTSADVQELARYRQMPPLPLAGSPATGVCSQANGVVNGAVRCVTWVPDACELVNGSHLTPVYCANAQPVTSASRAVDTTTVYNVIQDGSGTIWGKSTTGANAMVRWTNGQWSPVAPPRPGYIAERLAPALGPDGRAVITWVNPVAPDASAPILLTLRRGDKTTTIPLPRADNAATVLPLAQDGLLFLRQTPAPGVQLQAVAATGGLKPVYTFQPSQFLAVTVGKATNFFHPLRATLDGQGSAWLWMPQVNRRTAQIYRVEIFNGFLIDHMGSFSYHANLAGLPAGASLSTLTRWDDTHLLAGVAGTGPYLIDVKTLQASPLPLPGSGDLRNISEVIRDGNDRYLIASTAPEPAVIGGTPQSRQNDLWRWRSGHWQLLVTGVDPANDYRLPSPRAVVALQGGLWLGTGDGVWYIPNGNDNPTLLRAGQGLPVSEVDALFRLDADHMLAVETPNASAVLSPATLLQPGAAPAGVTALANGEVFAPGPNHHLWGEAQRSLSEWDGTRWLSHPLPSGLANFPVAGVMPDTHGAIWLLPANCRFGPMAVYDSASHQWRLANDYRYALSQAGYTVQAVQDRYNMQPFNGPGHQIAFVGLCLALNYFNGEGWTLWNARRLPGGALQAPPFYDSTGRLSIDSGPDETWSWTGVNGWQKVDYQPRRPVPTLPPPLTTAPPANCPTTWPSSLVTDRLGRDWWTADGNLYVGTRQACRVVLSAAQPQPFRDGRKLNAAYVGPNGQVFLDTEGPSLRQFVQIATVPALAPAAQARP